METLPARAPGFGRLAAAVMKCVNFFLPKALQTATTAAMVPRSSSSFPLSTSSFPAPFPGWPEDSRQRFRERTPGTCEVCSLRLRSTSTFPPSPRRKPAAFTIGGEQGGCYACASASGPRAINLWSFPKVDGEVSDLGLRALALSCTRPFTGVWRLGHRGRRSGRALGPCHG